MKFCLLISGHLRTFRSCLPYQKKMLVDTLGCDVFFHTWSETESKTNSWHSNHMCVNETSDEHIQFIKHHMKPKHIVVEEQLKHELNKNLHESSISLDGLKNMTYGFKRVYQMMLQYQKEHSIHYDFIIKLRPDILLTRPILMNMLNLQQNSILFFGNHCPIVKHSGTKMPYHNFRAMDILSISSNDDASNGVFGLFDSFDQYYMKQSWHHSPYLDFVLDKNIPFEINTEYLYDRDWKIARG
jgi:hypothetical protein